MAAEPPKTFDRTDDGEAPVPDRPAAIGPYRVERRLGEGGMGEVFEAYDPRLMRTVAVKRVRARGSGGGLGAKARARFWREARALAAIDHPGVVRVFEIGETDDGDLFLAMQRVQGAPLSTHLGEAPWPPADALALGRALAAILAAVHAAGVVHRDLKPANIIVQPDGSPVLVDFGIAMGHDVHGAPLTETGQVVGTVSYMAPEQLEGHAELGPAVDVFAWGILLYRLVTGRHPFARATREQMAVALASGRFAPLAPLAPGAPAPLVALIERCLSVRPDARPADGAALARALDALPGLGPPAAPLAAAIPAWPAPALASAGATPDPLGATELPVASGVHRAVGRRRRWRWALAGLAAIGAAAVALALAAPSSTPSGEPLRSLPPRPVVALLPLDGAAATGPEAEFATVLTAVLRADLEASPDALVAAPAAVADRADVVVSGHLGDGRADLTLTDRRDGRVRWSAATDTAGRDAQSVARDLAAGLLGALGAAHEPAAAQSTPEVWADTVAAVDAGRRGDEEEVSRRLQTVFRLDPSFVPARMEELALLAAQRRTQDLATAAERLAPRQDLGPHERGMLAAWRALGRSDSAGALRALYDVIDRWPYDELAYETLLGLLFTDARVGNLAEAERLAAQALTFSRSPGVVSRFVRAAAWRGGADGIEVRLGALGLAVDGDTKAEIALYRGDFTAAAAGLDAWLRREPEHPFPLNMGIAAGLLAGRCDVAASRAAERITVVENRGTDDNLSWTYSLLVQALTCLGQWDLAEKNLDRWRRRHPGDEGQITWFGWDLRIARTPDDPALADGLAAAVVKSLSESPAESHGAPPDGCERLSLLATDARMLDRCVEVARAQSFDLDVPARARLRWERVLQRVEARRAELAGETEAALAAYRKAVFPLAGVRAEEDLMQRVESLFALARALDAAHRGDEAEVAYRAVVDAGYARLYRTALWSIARAHASR